MNYKRFALDLHGSPKCGVLMCLCIFEKYIRTLRIPNVFVNISFCFFFSLSTKRLFLQTMVMRSLCRMVNAVIITFRFHSFITIKTKKKIVRVFLLFYNNLEKRVFYSTKKKTEGKGSREFFLFLQFVFFFFC